MPDVRALSRCYRVPFVNSPECPMPRNQAIDRHLTAFNAILEECTGLKSRVETERDAVSAVTAALTHAGEALAQRGLVSRHRVEGLTSSVEENALDLRTALDEVDASIRAAIGPVEAFARATERIGTAREMAQRAALDPATGLPTNPAELERIESVAAQHSALCERLLAGYRELADTATRTLDDLCEKIDRLQAAFGEVTAAMSPSYTGMWH
jgi:phage shock protein A